MIVPVSALVIDWVFADGPPKEAFLYDNNSHQDFHELVPLRTPEELYWSEEESLMFRKLQEERRLKEEAMRVKVSILFNHTSNYICTLSSSSSFFFCFGRWRQQLV